MLLELVDVGRLDELRPIAAQKVMPELVGHNKDNVGFVAHLISSQDS
jgi:hypothetical protein